MTASKTEKLLSVFCRLSGYSREEIMGVNEKAFTFSTSTGGKYQLSRDGKKIRVLSGPPFPKQSPQTEITTEG